MNRKLRFLAIFIALLMALAPVFTFAPAAEAATPPQPTYTSAVVDGDYSEWDLETDFFADMYRAANPNNDVLAKLYVRYECGTGGNPGIVYVLVLAQNGYPLFYENEGDFVKIGAGGNDVDNTVGNDGSAPDFEFVTSGGENIGWEASFPLANGSYSDFDVHTNVDDGASQTAAVANRSIDLTVDCSFCNPSPSRSITGLVFFDQNENGVFEPPFEGEDMALSGVEVYLSDATAANGNSLVENNLLETAVTDAEGIYTFSNLAPGTYEVSQEDQAGYIEVTGPQTIVIGNEECEVFSGTDFIVETDPGPTAISLADINTDGNNWFVIVVVLVGLALTGITGLSLRRREN